MGASAFQQGVRIEIEHKQYILLRKISESLWQLEECRTKRVHEYSDDQLRLLYADGHLLFSDARSRPANDNARSIGAVNADLAPEQWAEAKVRRAYVIATLDAQNTEQAMVADIQTTWLKLREPEAPPNWTTVYRWKKKYLAAGKDIRALAVDRHQQGNCTNRYPDEVMAIAENAITNHYLIRTRPTLQHALDIAKALVLRENKLRPDAIQLPLPTRRLFKRMIEAIPAFDRRAARYGRTAAVKHFRSVLAHRITSVPLERAEIDHTPLDLMVIDDDTALPLGRPWVTACIDDNSRNVLGIYVSFEPPSYFTVARCLQDAFRPKVALRDKYPRVKGTWDAHGVMRELVVDNGVEFHSESLENACYSLGIEIHYSARKTPWFKGKIERFLGTLNADIAHGQPGTTFRNIFEKDDYDPSKHAVVRLSTLQEIIRMWIVDVYHQKPHRALDAPPAVVWKSRINPEDILLPEDPAELEAILGRSEERCLTHKGIELNGLFYNSPELKLLRIKQGGNVDVQVRVDESDLGHIVVLSPDGTQMFKTRALFFEYANGLTSWQHRICKNFAARELKKHDPESWLEAKLTIVELIEEEFMHKKQKTRTKIARYKGNAKPVPVKKPDPPAALPAAQQAVAEETVEPLTEADISASTSQSPLSRKKFTPLHRERLPYAIEVDQADSTTEVSHDQ